MRESSDPNLSATVARLREFYARRRVLVVGADGFLGVNCVAWLGRLGARVAIVSRRAAPRAADFAGPVFRGDLREVGLADAAVAEQDVVFDFAGATGATDSNAAPLENVHIEAAPHLALFHACATAASPPRVVFCSSRLVYGRPERLPVDEAHPLQPASLYAAHKIAAENYLSVFRQTHGLHASVVRLSNPYGRNDHPEAKSYGAINRFIQLAQAGQPIRVFGDGAQLRDYIHVDDTLLAFLAIAATPACCGETFNLGGRQPIRLRDAVELIAASAGGTPVEYAPWPADLKSVETGDYYTDLSKLDRFVALPEQCSFAEGLRRTLGPAPGVGRALGGESAAVA